MILKNPSKQILRTRESEMGIKANLDEFWGFKKSYMEPNNTYLLVSNKYFMNSSIYKDFEQQIERLQKELIYQTDSRNQIDKLYKNMTESNALHVNALKISIKNHQEKAKKLETQLSNQQQLKQKLKSQLNKTTKDLQKASKESKQFKKRIQELSSLPQLSENTTQNRKTYERTQNTKEIQSLKLQLKQKLSQNLKLAHQRQNFQKQIKRLSIDLQSLEIKNKQLRQEKESRQNSFSFPSEIPINSTIDTANSITIQQKSSLMQAQSKKFVLNQLQRVIDLKKQQKSMTPASQQKIKALEESLAKANDEKEILKQKLANLQSESLKNIKSIHLQNQLELSRESVISKRKIDLDGRQNGERLPIQAKQTHKDIFNALVYHFNSVIQKNRISFLNMLAFWTEQKLCKIYKQIQERRAI